MQKTNLTLTTATCALAMSCFAATAHAHISMTGALMSRDGDQKHFPCDGAKGDGPVYTFAPGSTITLAINEDIAHPSYFRIAFDNDGEDAFVEPKSIKPIEASRPCPVDANDKCGESDFCNVVSTDGATVLWDNLNPHIASAAKPLSWNIKLPDIECDNCTIQVLQIMEDNAAHGAYCPTGSCMDSSLEDIYHRCIDIKLVKGATNGAGATTMPVNNMGMACGAGAAPTAGSGAPAGGSGAAGSSAATGGTTAAGGSAAPAGGTGGAAGATAAAGGSKATTPPVAPAGGSTAKPPSGGTTGTQTGTQAAAGKSAPPSGTPVTTPSAAAGNESAAPAASTDSGGCAVAAGTSSTSSFASFSLLLLGAALVRRRRRSE